MFRDRFRSCFVLGEGAGAAKAFISDDGAATEEEPKKPLGQGHGSTISWALNLSYHIRDL